MSSAPLGILCIELKVSLLLSLVIYDDIYGVSKKNSAVAFLLREDIKIKKNCKKSEIGIIYLTPLPPYWKSEK